MSESVATLFRDHDVGKLDVESFLGDVATGETVGKDALLAFMSLDLFKKPKTKDVHTFHFNIN